MTISLKLKESYKQIETELGTIDIEQVEDGIQFIVEIFPTGQTNDSFQNAEFCNVWNALECAVNPDFTYLYNIPENWTHKQRCEVECEVTTTILNMLGSIQNLEDFREVTIFEKGIEIPVYDSLKVLNNNYVKRQSKVR